MHSYRLPVSVVPLRYEIQITPELSSGTFRGVETIEVEVQEAVNEIVMNAADLTVGQVTIQDGDGVILHGTATLEHATERVRLVFPQVLGPGSRRLSLSFAGILSDKLRGFYRSTVKVAQSPISGPDGDGTQNMLAATQFEATDARRAFPCWDEPAIKAVFQLSLVIEDGLTAISNSPVLAEDPLPGTGKKTVRFAPTIRMSTYLVAFVVGKLEGSEAIRPDGTPVRIWCAPGKVHLTRWAQEIAVFSFRFFQEYYGVPYPGDKLDLIAIPDFAFGAMENLGAITFRETALLVDEKVATHAELERVADVVAHEIAHMWFGDLVTMAWWNGLWLNEAFATFMEMLAVDAWKPAWRRWVTFSVSRAAALLVDGLASSRPIEFEVVAPQDADAMFDVLTYEKGGAVLRMLEQYLGPPAFRGGVQRYLDVHRFGNAETADLWRALGESSRQAIPAIMDGWIFRPGYPLVTVETDASGNLRLSQRRFTYVPAPSGDSELWQVPINFRIRMDGGVRSTRLLLSSAEQDVKLSGRPDWVVVNEGGHGFYRVRYAPGLLAQLLGEPFEILAPVERFNLINDAWAMTLAGHLSAAEYLDLTARLREETDRNVWAALLASFSYLHRVIAPSERSHLEALVCDRLGRAMAQFGLAPRMGEDELTSQLRGELVRAMGTLGNDPAIQAQVRDVYAAYRREPASVAPDVLTASIAILAHKGGEAEFAEFLQKFKTAQTPQEEQRYLFSLAGFRDPGLLQRTLQFAISGDVRTQDAPYLVRSVLLNVDGRDLAWQFIKAHWETMQRQYPLGGLRRMCEGVTALATPALEEDVRQFFTSRKISLGGKTLEQYLEQLRIAVVFGEREASHLKAYLDRFR